MKLLIEALVKFTCGLVLVGALIFLPAGTLRYTYGWLLMGLLFAPMLAAGFVMLAKSPEFLKKRLDTKEKQGKQKGVVAASGLMFIAGCDGGAHSRRGSTADKGTARLYPVPAKGQIQNDPVYLVRYAADYEEKPPIRVVLFVADAFLGIFTHAMIQGYKDNDCAKGSLV